MQRGTLAEEYRTQCAPDGKGTVRLGPYYKHQCWEAGRNLSRRVPAHEVPLLRQDIANAQCFERLTKQLADVTVAQTRSLRTAQVDAMRTLDEQARAGKKNFRKNAPLKNSMKPKPSVRKRTGASSRKA